MIAFVHPSVHLIFVICCADKLVITFANSLDPNQDRQNVCPDLDPSCLKLVVFLEEFNEKVNFDKSQQTTTKHKKLSSMQRVNALCTFLRSAGTYNNSAKENHEKLQGV